MIVGDSSLIESFTAQFCGFIVFWFINMYSNAVVALVVGVVPVLLGLWIEPMEIFDDTGWFVGFFLSFAVYAGLMAATGAGSSEGSAGS